jgi:hypothetical protein
LAERDERAEGTHMKISCPRHDKEMMDCSDFVERRLKSIILRIEGFA